MKYTLGAAAKATGKSKATISKAIKSGRISALKDDYGVFRIDPSELHRVYPLNTSAEETSKQEDPGEHLATIRELTARLEAAVVRLQDKDAVISDLKEDRDKWRQQATALLSSPHQKRWLWPFKKK